jgi:hypothetical protein
MLSGQKFKGAGMKVIIDFIRYRFGDEGLQKVMKKVSPVAREIATRRIRDNEWIPDEYGDEIMVKMDEIFGNGDGALIRDASKYIAESNLKGVYKAFAKMSSIESLLGRASTLWKRYYNQGDVEILDKGPGYIEAEIVDYRPFRSTCLGLQGWIDMIFEFYKTDGSIEHPECKMRGDKRCVFILKWKK